MNPNWRLAKAAYRPLGRFIPNPKLKLQDQLAEVCRFKHFSKRTEEAYWYWTKRFLIFNQPRRGQFWMTARLRHLDALEEARDHGHWDGLWLTA